MCIKEKNSPNWVHVKEGEKRVRDVKCVTERSQSKSHKSWEFSNRAEFFQGALGQTQAPEWQHHRETMYRIRKESEESKDRVYFRAHSKTAFP